MRIEKSCYRERNEGTEANLLRVTQLTSEGASQGVHTPCSALNTKPSGPAIPGALILHGYTSPSFYRRYVEIGSSLLEAKHSGTQLKVRAFQACYADCCSPWAPCTEISPCEHFTVADCEEEISEEIIMSSQRPVAPTQGPWGAFLLRFLLPWTESEFRSRDYSFSIQLGLLISKQLTLGSPSRSALPPQEQQ